MPVCLLLVFAGLWIASREFRRRRQVSSSVTLATNFGIMAANMGRSGGDHNSCVQVAKVVLTGVDGQQQEILDFHLPPSARLADARRALKTVLPLDSVIYFQDKDLSFIPLVSEVGLTVGDVMRDGAVQILDAANSAQNAGKREFCTCGAVADFECSRCQSQGYCSAECQEAHWPQHSTACQAQPQGRARGIPRPPVQGARIAGLTQAAPSNSSLGSGSVSRRTSVPAGPRPPRPSVVLTRATLESSSSGSDGEGKEVRSSQNKIPAVAANAVGPAPGDAPEPRPSQRRRAPRAPTVSVTDEDSDEELPGAKRSSTAWAAPEEAAAVPAGDKAVRSQRLLSLPESDSEME